MPVMTEDKQEILEDEIRLDGFLKRVWRGKWLIILLVLVASAAAAAIGLREPALSTATALIEVGKVWGKPLKDIYVTVEIANSPGFIRELAAKSGVTPGLLRRSVQVAAVESGVPHSIYAILIRVTAKTESPEESVRLAQAVADEIIARHEKLFQEAIAPHLERQHQLEQRLKEATPSDRDLTFKLEGELDELKANNQSPISSEKTHLVESIVPGPTIRPDIWRGTATAALIAAVAGVAAACLIGYYKTPRQ